MPVEQLVVPVLHLLSGLQIPPSSQEPHLPSRQNRLLPQFVPSPLFWQVPPTQAWQSRSQGVQQVSIETQDEPQTLRPAGHLLLQGSSSEMQRSTQARPATQSKSHLPAEHLACPPAGLGQDRPQDPQLLIWLRLVSQPSSGALLQSPKPDLHEASVQRPATHLD
jgi:hypothetical protein